MTKGIKLSPESQPEFLLLGSIAFNKGKFVMAKPELIIGSDRLELYEHFARRREVLTGLNRNWLKLAAGATLAHFLLVEVPTLFSRFFGDEVSSLEKKLGSEDQSHVGLKMSRLKSNVSKRKELQ